MSALRLYTKRTGASFILIQQSSRSRCPECDGLGVIEYFDEDKIINPQLSLLGGAVRGWDRRNDHYTDTIKSLAQHYGFDAEQKFRITQTFGEKRDTLR